MKVILFGATGIVGQGVLRECLADATVEEGLLVGRNASPVDHPKIRQIVGGESQSADDLHLRVGARNR